MVLSSRDMPQTKSALLSSFPAPTLFHVFAFPPPISQLLFFPPRHVLVCRKREVQQVLHSNYHEVNQTSLQGRLCGYMMSAA